MSKREDANYLAWVGEIGEKLTPELRSAWEKLSDADEIREQLYRGTLRSEDYYRRLNEVDAKKKENDTNAQRVAQLQRELNDWYENEAPKNEALIAERDLLRAQLEDLGNDVPAAAGVGNISIEELAAIKAKAETADQLNKMLPVILAETAAMVKDSIRQGFDVDPREVIRVSMQQGLTPYKAYELMTAEQRAKQYEKQREDERKKWMEEGRRQATTASNGSPDHIRPSGPSVVEFLTRDDQKESSRQDRVRAALSAYEEGNY